MAGYSGRVTDDIGDSYFGYGIGIWGVEERSAVLSLKNGQLGYEAPITTGDADESTWSNFIKKQIPTFEVLAATTNHSEQEWCIFGIDTDNLEELHIIRLGINGDDIISQYKFDVPTGYTFIGDYITELRVLSDRYLLVIDLYDVLNDEFHVFAITLSFLDEIIESKFIDLPDIDSINLSQDNTNNPVDRFAFINAMELYYFDQNIDLVWSKTVDIGTEPITYFAAYLCSIDYTTDNNLHVVFESDGKEYYGIFSGLDGSLIDSMSFEGFNSVKYIDNFGFSQFSLLMEDIDKYGSYNFNFSAGMSTGSARFFSKSPDCDFDPEYMYNSEFFGRCNIYDGSINNVEGMIGLTGLVGTSFTSTTTLYNWVNPGRILSHYLTGSDHLFLTFNSESNLQVTKLERNIDRQFRPSVMYGDLSPLELARFGECSKPQYFKAFANTTTSEPSVNIEGTTLAVTAGPTVSLFDFTFGSLSASNAYQYMGEIKLNDTEPGYYSIPQKDSTIGGENIILIMKVSGSNIVPKIQKV